MIRILMWGFLIYIGYRIVLAMIAKGSGKESGKERETEADKATSTFKDPVCGVYVSEDDAVIGRLDGERHYFCSMDCLEKFREQLEHKP